MCKECDNFGKEPVLSDDVMETEPTCQSDSEDSCPFCEEDRVENSSLMKFAKEELIKAGLFDKDSSYGGMLGESTMKLMECFVKEGHSGFSASMQVEIFRRLASWKPLTPLTNDPAEWSNVTEHCSNDRKPLWQSRRSPDCFSNDEGKTYYSVDDKDRTIINSEPMKV